MRVLVVDDEPLARARLLRVLEQVPEMEVVGEAANGRDAVQLASSLAPDIVLLDIRMPGMDGIEAARHLRELEAPPAVIFTTAFDEHALEALSVHAIGYLLKPVRRDALAEALRAASRPNRAQLAALAEPGDSTRTCIAARTHMGLELIPVNEILYFRADHKYVTVRHPGGEVLIDEPLKDLETEFEGRFERIHRNALVARSAIEALERDAEGQQQLRLRGIDERLAVSRRHLAGLRKVLRDSTSRV